MRILLIDDRHKDLKNTVIIPLEDLGYEVIPIAQPMDGLRLSNPNFNVIFVDYVFENSLKYTGTILGMQIRKKCPLVPLVLLTANGKEKIRDFIYVGFDDYFDKNIEAESEEEVKERLTECISTAIKNSQKRNNLRNYSVEELENVKNRLTNINQGYINCKAISKKTIQKIATEVAKIEGIATLRGQTISEFFQTTENGSLKIEALKIRQLVIENPTEWDESKGAFSPFIKLIKEFFEEGFELSA